MEITFKLVITMDIDNTDNKTCVEGDNNENGDNYGCHNNNDNK